MMALVDRCKAIDIIYLDLYKAFSAVLRDIFDSKQKVMDLKDGPSCG